MVKACLISLQIQQPVSGRDISFVHLVAGFLQEVYLTNWPFIFVSHFESSPSHLGSGSTSAFKFDIDHTEYLTD